MARAYVLYREERARQRVEPSAPPVLSVTRADGSKHPLDQERLTAVTEEACAGLAADLMVFDLARIGVTDDEVWHDRPAGTPRRVQGAEGAHHVVVNGQVVLDHNRPHGCPAWPHPAQRVTAQHTAASYPCRGAPRPEGPGGPSGP